MVFPVPPSPTVVHYEGSREDTTELGVRSGLKVWDGQKLNIDERKHVEIASDHCELALRADMVRTENELKGRDHGLLSRHDV